MTQCLCDEGRRNSATPMQKLLIGFALSVLLLGATINVDDHLARASDGGPQGADKNSSSGMVSKHPTGDNTRGEGLYNASCVVCHGPRATGGIGPRLAGNPVLSNEQAFWKIRVRRATRDAAVKRRLDGATDGRYPGLVEDAALIRKALFYTPPIPFRFSTRILASTILQPCPGGSAKIGFKSSSLISGISSTRRERRNSTSSIASTSAAGWPR